MICLCIKSGSQISPDLKNKGYLLIPLWIVAKHSMTYKGLRCKIKAEESLTQGSDYKESQITKRSKT